LIIVREKERGSAWEEERENNVGGRVGLGVLALPGVKRRILWEREKKKPNVEGNTKHRRRAPFPFREGQKRDQEKSEKTKQPSTKTTQKRRNEKSPSQKEPGEKKETRQRDSLKSEEKLSPCRTVLKRVRGKT